MMIYLAYSIIGAYSLFVSKWFIEYLRGLLGLDISNFLL